MTCLNAQRDTVLWKKVHTDVVNVTFWEMYACLPEEGRYQLTSAVISVSNSFFQEKGVLLVHQKESKNFNTSWSRQNKVSEKNLKRFWNSRKMLDLPPFTLPLLFDAGPNLHFQNWQENRTGCMCQKHQLRFCCKMKMIARTCKLRKCNLNPFRK